MNFIEPIYQQLLLNKDINLIKWPNGNYSTGQTLLDSIIKYQEILPKSNECVFLAKPFDEQTLGMILASITNGNPIIIYPKGYSIKNIIKYLKVHQVKYAFADNFILKLLLKWNSISILTNIKKHLSTIDIVSVNDNLPALISFSSGSTGIHKPIYRSHKLLFEQVHAIHETFNAWLNCTDFPLFANILLYNLSFGKKTIIPSIVKFDLNNLNPDAIISQLLTNKIETITGNEFYFESICNTLIQQQKTIEYIKGIGIGGSPISNILVDKMKNCFPNASIQIIYGTTEAEPISIKTIEYKYYPSEMGYNVGIVHPLIDIKINPIFNSNINDQNIDFGEINVKGNHVAKQQENEYLQTGDYGYIWNNELFLTARAGNIENINGIQHLQIEHCLHENFNHKIPVVIRNKCLYLYSEKNIAIEKIEQLLFAIFKYKFTIKLTIKKIPTDSRHLSKVLYHKI